ncbi:MAG TPA: hypothetical protein VL443_16340 [Cyclobacteriaceae bacterium]|nr:hypothetical protein [Cyclobacteriaceae bacterium]
MPLSIIVLLVLLTISIDSFTQINFEKGYFIDNNDVRIECLIKSKGWKNNPVEFEYKLEEGAESKKGLLIDVREFGIIGGVKYVRMTVDVDHSSQEIGHLGINKEPLWINEQLFLKVILEGKSALYGYDTPDLKRFFYSVSNLPVQQLVWKQYLSVQGEILTNNKFRQQLWTDVRCTDTKEESVKALRYYEQDLIRYFKKYNNCFGGESVNHNAKTGHSFIAIKIMYGINYSSASIGNVLDKHNAVYNNCIGFTTGLDLEFHLPYNKNKLGIIITPTFHSFKTTSENKNSTLEYNTIEFPVGVRYHSYLGKDFNLFIDFSFIPNSSLKLRNTINFKKGYYYNNSDPLNLNASPTYAIGLGVNYKRLGAEIRYFGQRGILIDYSDWLSHYKRISMVIGYRLFKSK